MKNKTTKTSNPNAGLKKGDRLKQVKFKNGATFKVKPVASTRKPFKGLKNLATNTPQKGATSKKKTA